MDTESSSTAKGSYSLKVCVKSKKGETKSTHLYTGINSGTGYPAFSRSAVAAVAGIMRGYDFKDYGIGIAVSTPYNAATDSPTFSADATTQDIMLEYFQDGYSDPALVKFLTYVVSQTYPILRKASRVANVTEDDSDEADPCLIDESGGRFTGCVQNCIFELSVTVH